MKNICILVFWLAIPLTTLAQLRTEATISIKGQIADSADFESIPYAAITITRLPENIIEKRMASDADGKFEAFLQNPGDYSLTASSVGYQSVTKPFTIKEAYQTYDFGRLILHQSNIALGEVKVTADKPLVKVEADKLSYNAESDPDAKTTNALELLRKVPLITVDGDENIQVRGSGNFKIFINGRPSTMASNNPKDFLRSLSSSTIKDIEVITSPGAKYDAEGVGGIINIITLKKTMDGYSGNVFGGTNTLGAISSGVSFSANFGKFGISTTLSNYYSNGFPIRNYTYRESYQDSLQMYSYWKTRSEYNGNSPSGNLELSYEFDSLNLVSGSFNIWYGMNRNMGNTRVSVMDYLQAESQSYNISNSNRFSFGAPEGSLDYQHTSKRNKEKLFTLSYKFNANPTGDEGESTVDNVVNFSPSRRITDNNAHSLEHTFQLDFVQPVTKTQKLEYGVKYILRKNKSITDASIFDFDLGQFVPDSFQINGFDYTQNIMAGYLSYNRTMGKFSLKSGLRVENVFSDGTFSSKELTDFNYRNLEIVPSASISYQVNQSNSLRLSYNKRVQRPGIWYLNPYVNNMDPKNIYYGNPNLYPERFHSLELNYNLNFKAGNVNMTLYNTFSNNGIDRIIRLEDGVTKATFENVLAIQTWGASSYVSLRIGKKFNASMNGAVNYNDIKGNNDAGLENSGFGYNTNTNLQYTIVKGLKISSYLMLFKPSVGLQRNMGTFTNMGITLTKELFKSKMTASLSVRNFLTKDLTFSYKMFDSYFYQETEMYRPGRMLSINLRYRFGEMDTQLKKARRGIKNDDVKAGEGNGVNNN